MYSLYKFVMYLYRIGLNLLDPNVNALRHMPTHIRYFASIIIACFWCLAFGLYFGELYYIGYNMLGHRAIISMVFVTWSAFKTSEYFYGPGRGEHYLRQPDRSSRCDELSDEQREELAKKI